ncbi:MAG: hypothetical protein HYZ42_09415 [Bacteroidetes bacterium]|nr:hypothetical protein [Bacteroidota bacterium]
MKYIFHGFDFKAPIKVDGKATTVQNEQIAFIQALTTFDPIGSPGYQPKNDVQTSTASFGSDAIVIKW